MTQKVSREEELLRGAIVLFSRNGFRETSMQELADQLNITRPLVYYYFESKEELLWRIIGHLTDNLLEQARPIAAGEAAPLSRLRLLIDAHVRTLLANLDAFRILFAERHNVTGRQDLRLKRGEGLYHALISGVVAEAQEAGVVMPGNPRLIAKLAMSSANSILRWYLPGATTPPATITSTTVDFIVRGLSLATTDDVEQR